MQNKQLLLAALCMDWQLMNFFCGACGAARTLIHAPAIKVAARVRAAD